MLSRFWWLTVIALIEACFVLVLENAFGLRRLGRSPLVIEFIEGPKS